MIASTTWLTTPLAMSLSIRMLTNGRPAETGSPDLTWSPTPTGSLNSIPEGGRTAPCARTSTSRIVDRLYITLTFVAAGMVLRGARSRPQWSRTRRSTASGLDRAAESKPPIAWLSRRSNASRGEPPARMTYATQIQTVAFTAACDPRRHLACVGLDLPHNRTTGNATGRGQPRLKGRLRVPLARLVIAGIGARRLRGLIRASLERWSQQDFDHRGSTREASEPGRWVGEQRSVLIRQSHLVTGGQELGRQVEPLDRRHGGYDVPTRGELTIEVVDPTDVVHIEVQDEGHVRAAEMARGTVPAALQFTDVTLDQVMAAQRAAVVHVRNARRRRSFERWLHCGDRSGVEEDLTDRHCSCETTSTSSSPLPRRNASSCR